MAGVTGPVAPSGRAQPGHRLDQRPARNRQRLLRQRRRRAGAHERRHGRRAEPRLDRRVPRADEQLRSRVRQLQRRHRQRRHQVGQRHVPRQRCSSSSATPRSTPATTSRPSGPTFNQNQPGGTRRRSDQEGQAVLLRRLSGARGRRRASRPATSRCRRWPSAAGNFSGHRRSADRQRQRRVLGEPAVAAARLRRVAPGEPYYTPGCTSVGAVRVSERGRFRQRAWSAPAQQLLQYIPDAERRRRARSRPARSSRPSATTRARSASTATRRFGLLTGYYFFDDYRSTIRIPGSRAARTSRASTR